MSDQTTHPSPEELSAFNLGQLPPQTASVVESHVSECESCCETLLGLASNDTFVALLKEAKQPADESDYATFVTENVRRHKGDQPTVPETLTEHTRYEIVRLIGKGGMGDVFEARHRMMDRTVALKVINHEFIRKPQAVDRFHREVKAAARLSHPNIVTAYDAEQAGDLHFLVMEYVDGIDLARLVQERGALPAEEACEFTRQAALGLQHACEQNMVHRDIKPHNLMVTADGTVKILDFGLASLAPEALQDADHPEISGALTAAGSIVGTPDFISPEQAKDAHQADIRSDIYSLGATLYYLLSGRAPFADASVIEKLKRHAEQEPVPLKNLQIEIPEELAEVIRKMMAKDPAERFQTPQEVADALDRISAQLRLISGTHPPQDFTAGRQADAQEHRKNIKSLADLLLGTAFLNMVWIAIVVSNAYFNLGGFTVSPFWETFGAPLFYSSLVGVPLSLMLGFGARRMRRFQSYRWSMAAAILAMIPVTPVNVVLGLVCGLWAMVLLVRPEVKRMFVAGDQSHETGTPLVERSRSTAPGSVHSSAGRIPRWAVGVGVFGFACMLAGIFYIQIGTTTLKFEVLDPDIQVRFAGESVVFQDRNGADSTFTIKPGTKQEFVVEQSGAVVETDSLKLNRGDKIVLKIDVVDGQIAITPNDNGVNLHRTPEPIARAEKSETKASQRATAETRRQFQEMIDAARAAETDEELHGVVSGYSPMLSLLSQDAGGDLIELLAELPDEMQESLLHDGHLKWKADELDEKRKRVMLDMFAAVLSQAPNNENTRKKLEQLDAYANVSDVGFAVIDVPDSDAQVVVWYFLRRDVKSPTVLLVSGSTSTALQEAIKPQKHFQINQRVADIIDAPYTDLPPLRVASFETTEALKSLIESLPADDSDEAWKAFLGQNAPPIEDFPVEFLRKPLQLIAGLPETTRQELLDRGYLKWRLSELDEERGELNRELIKEMLESAMKASGLDDQTLEKIIESRQASGDVGFVVATVPTTNSQIIVWYMQNPDSLPIPIPMMVPILGVKAEFKDQALSKSVYKQVGGVDDKPYTELPPAPIASREIRESLQTLLKYFPEGEVSDEVWIEYLSEYSPFLADTRAPSGIARDLVALLHSLPPETIDALLEQGFVKWPFRKLDEPRQQKIRSIMRGIMSAIPEEHRNEKTIDIILNSIVTADVGFAVLQLPDSNQQFVAFFAQMPSSFSPSILPVVGGLKDNFQTINTPAVQKQIEEFVKQPDSVLPAAIPPTAQNVRPATQAAIEQLVAAASQASTDAEWEQILAKHAPMLAVTDESESEQFGKTELDSMRNAGRTLIQLFAGLSDPVHEDLLQDGYLKWRFKELDEPRQSAMKEALSDFLSASSKMGFPADLKDRVPEILAMSDVGFAVIDTEHGQQLLWYSQMPETLIPITFPMLTTPPEDEATPSSRLRMRSVYKQLEATEDKPYSKLPPAITTETSHHIKLIREFKGRAATSADWQFINWYFHHFTGANPFGHSSSNLGSLYKGLVKDTFSSFKHLRKTAHTHNPVDDARGNAEALLQMKDMGLKISLK